MRNFFLILFYFVFIKSYLQSQVTFNKTVDFEHGDETAFSIVPVPNGYIIAGHGYGYESEDFYEVKLKFANIDTAGNVLWQKVFVDSGFNLYCEVQSGVYLSDGSVVFGGHRLTDSTSEIIVIKLNPVTGDTIFYKTFSFDDWIYGLQVRQLSTGELIMLAFDSNALNGYLLLKMKINGELIWSKTYGGSSEVSPSDFEIDTDDHIWLINKYLYCSPPGSLIREIDSAGIVLALTFVPDYCLFAGIKTHDGGFYGPGGYYPIPPYQQFTYRMDSLGNVLWVYESLIDFDTLASGELYTGTSKELANGDLINVGYYGTNTGQYISIVSKVDLFGNPIWERYYTAVEENYSDRFTELALTPDNGILIIGAGQPEDIIESQNFWILKLDSMGCLYPGCDTLGNAITSLLPNNQNLQIYPNPIVQEATVQLQYNPPLEIKDLYFKIMDITGRLVESQSVSDVLDNGSTLRFKVRNEKNLLGLYLISIYSGPTQLGNLEIFFE